MLEIVDPMEIVLLFNLYKNIFLELILQRNTHARTQKKTINLHSSRDRINLFRCAHKQKQNKNRKKHKQKMRREYE